MNKTEIKKFAIDARKKLMASVADRAGFLGITPEECSDVTSQGKDFAVYKTAADTEVTLYGEAVKQRQKLVDEIEMRGFEAVVEEVAYTWFNRIIAIRFMEVNDYLPTRVRVLSSEKKSADGSLGKTEPDLVTLAPNVDMEFTDTEKEYIITAKTDNKLDELFRMLFIKQCKELHKILPALFEETDDYTEMLLNISFTNKDDVVRMLVDKVEEKDFDVTSEGSEGQVEIIGWLYQYYNTELKDDTFALLKKNVKITKERIPAATQLFTPDWIVRYMVENSLGRLWIEHLRANDPTVDEKEMAEKFGWKYYLPEAEQEDSVNVQLAEIRTSYKDMTPTDILCIDPCMGSGHILIYMFDVLIDIYKSAGYSERDAAFYIVENNIRGLDIDNRAYQLAYFAVMMKGRGYNRRFFRGREINQGGKTWIKYPSPNLYAIKESNALPSNMVQQLQENFEDVFTENDIACLKYVQEVFKDAREYGSILNVDSYVDRKDRMYASVGLTLYSLWAGDHEYCRTHDMNLIQLMVINEVYLIMSELLFQAQVMCEKYDSVITNPPYMSSGNMSYKLSEFVKNKYPNCNADIFAAFIDKSIKMCKHYGNIGMVTMHTWMFQSSFEKCRSYILDKITIDTINHLGKEAFDGIVGKIVATVAFTMKNYHIEDYSGKAVRLVDFYDSRRWIKNDEFFNHENRYEYNISNIYSIPGKPIAYWVSNNVIDAFKNYKPIKELLVPKQGTSTGNDEKYVRYWFEIDFSKFTDKIDNLDAALRSQYKYYPLDKGGEFRKWYGNNEKVIKMDNLSYSELLIIGNHLPSKQYYFFEGITWSKIAAELSVRYDKSGFVFSSVGLKGFPDGNNIYKLLAFLNSNVCKYFVEILSPGISIVSGDIEKIPYINVEFDDIGIMAIENIAIEKEDWDAFEYSWDFSKHPFAKYETDKVEIAYEKWENDCQKRLGILKQNEEKINEIFIREYELEDVLNNAVEKGRITVSLADIKKDVELFISYFVGCLFGRYNIKKDGIAFAGGKFDMLQYDSNIIDADNVVPITDDEYLDDDIVTKFISFLKVIFGEEKIDDNLDFIANALDSKGNNSREIVRNYFIKDFYINHCKTYQKHPIYWLFDSGKENGFKALIYMHRYDTDTVGRVRTDYLHKTQSAIENALQSSQYAVLTSNSASEKAKATKLIAKLTKQLAETKIYDEAIGHIANKRIELDLDDGVKVNYEKFQGVEVLSEGKKTVKVDLLAKIK